MSKTRPTLHETPTALASVQSWEDFHKYAASQTTQKAKGDTFELLVKAYLTLEPEYATKLRNVWLHKEVPPAVARHLCLPAQDQGIDLIAETKEGGFWAIQCKYREDTTHSLTWHDLSTFTGLAFGVCKGISFGLICTTTERITHVLKNQDRIGFCALDVWQGLDVEFFDRLRAYLGHRPKRLTPLKPRPHQQEAIKDAHRHFITKRESRGKLIMPCGTGKSLAAYWIAQRLGAKRVLIAVPSLALIRQTLKVWLRETMANGVPVEWICVCSDETAGQVDRDDIAVLRQDLGVPCVTDAREITRWLSKDNDSLSVIFTTYQSSEALAKAARKAGYRFELGIMDEAHKTVGAVGRTFSHLLYERNVRIHKRLFMTATERRYQGQSDEILSMEDPSIYGDTFHLLSFKKALDYNPAILSDYKIVTILVSREEVAQLIRKNVFVRPDRGRWDREIEAQMLASLVALRKAMQKYPIRHAVSFHSNIQRAEVFRAHNDTFSKAFQAYAAIDTFHVSGKTPTGTRARILQEFEQSKHALITNARCLTEGVDVPDIDCVLFADPRRSRVDIVQAVGRALRPNTGKKFGYVIIPILHDADAGSEGVFDSEEFKQILTTLRALASTDDRIIEYFRAISQGKRLAGGGDVSFELDEQLAKRIDLIAFTREINLRCWDRLAKLSWRPFEEARAFARGLKLENSDEWFAFCKGEMPSKGRLPADIPTAPQQVYADKGWKGMGDWLGTGNLATYLRDYRPFVKARAFARSLKLKSQREWFVFVRGEMPSKGELPADISTTPNRTYADKGWTSWGDWLGTGIIAARLRRYRSFSSGRTFARSLKLKSQTEWIAFCKGEMPSKGKLPSDIPACPNQTYANKGWKGYGDWLGTGAIAVQLRRFRSFVRARAFARGLELKSSGEWFAFCKGEMPSKGELPPDIPTNPAETYADKGWKGFGDWLGTGTIAPSLRQYRPFQKARAFARSLKLESQAQWGAFSKGQMPSKGRLPSDIPTHPDRTYADKGWKGMGDWLGTGSVATFLRNYRSFTKARAFARSLKLKSGEEWSAFCKGEMPSKGEPPPDIPTSPAGTYADKGWKGFGDWLGTGTIAPSLRQYRPFQKARAFARSLKLESGAEWSAFCKGEMPSKGKLPSDIPACPNQTYANKGWKSMGDWLGTGAVAPWLRRFRTFQKARAFARSLKLKSQTEWFVFCRERTQSNSKLPLDIPIKPDSAYADKGWKSWGDWLGTGTIAPSLRQFRSFPKARAFVRSLKLKSNGEWQVFCKGEMPSKGRLPFDMPSNPQQTYADRGWKGWGDWLGTGTVATRFRQYRPFPKARAFARGLKLKSEGDWRAFCKGEMPSKGKLPFDIPANPYRTYADKWKGMGDWLGTTRR